MFGRKLKCKKLPMHKRRMCNKAPVRKLRGTVCNEKGKTKIAIAKISSLAESDAPETDQGDGVHAKASQSLLIEK